MNNFTKIPEAGTGMRGEQGHISYLLRQAYSAHRIRMERALAPLGLTLPQFSVLTMLAAYPGASGAELARVTMLTPQTISVILGNLVRDGAVTRVPHAEHGRIQVISTTEAGRKLLARCKTAVRTVEADLLLGESADDERVIRRWLVKLATQETQNT